MHEADETEEHRLKLLEVREGATRAFEPSEQPLDFVAPLVYPSVVLLWSRRFLVGGTTGMSLKSSTSCLVSLPSLAQSISRCAG